MYIFFIGFDTFFSTLLLLDTTAALAVTAPDVVVKLLEAFLFRLTVLEVEKGMVGFELRAEPGIEQGNEDWNY